MRSRNQGRYRKQLHRLKGRTQREYQYSWYTHTHTPHLRQVLIHKVRAPGPLLLMGLLNVIKRHTLPIRDTGCRPTDDVRVRDYHNLDLQDV